MKKMKNQKGLTLVELLAVIVILGIISGIAVPSISGIINNSKAEAHTANVQMIKAAAKMATVIELAGGADGYTVTELVNGDFLEAAPLSPYDNVTPYSGTIGTDGAYTPGTEGADGKGPA